MNFLSVFLTVLGISLSSIHSFTVSNKIILSHQKYAAKLNARDLRMSAVESETVSLTEDGGVKKTVIRAGTGEKLTLGSIAKLSYSAKVAETGRIFAGGEVYRSTVNDKTMVPGWDIGLGSMNVGEKARISCEPSYGYGAEGIPPIIPSDASLEFEIEVLECEGNILNPSTFADNNPLTPRSPEGIMDAYLKRQEQKESEEQLEGLDAIKDFFKGIYVFGLFEGQTGERPPWYLNPFITFPAMFAVVAVAFYIVITSGGVTLERPVEELLDDVDIAVTLFKTTFG
mmetsp:Transcript_4751/g.6516  ORF Transcript_4751/g.6516 Transcript_4751/m.6516 type:complete len:285 (-) Transcript_4751:86-940(-)